MILTGAEPDELWPLIRDHHYSHRMPSNIQHCYAMRMPGGLFGDTGEVVAGCVFSIPPTRWSEDVLELTRIVRKPECRRPLTSLIAFACDWLRKSEHDLLVSFADWTQRHHGGIYQAASWNYDGQRAAAMDGVVIDGVFIPGRTATGTLGTRSPTQLAERMPDATVEAHWDEGKHLYWRALSKMGKRKAVKLELKSLPYPKPTVAKEVG